MFSELTNAAKLSPTQIKYVSSYDNKDFVSYNANSMTLKRLKIIND